MEASAGEDRDLRRWRITLTVAAWLLIVQSGLTLLSGVFGTILAPIADRAAASGQFGSMVDHASLVGLEAMLRQTAFLNRLQTVGSLALLVGSIGLLKRMKWGWYTVVVVHVAATAAVFIWVMPLFRNVYRVLDPANAGAMAVAMSILAALAPAVVVAFLLLKPVVSQLERVT